MSIIIGTYTPEWGHTALAAGFGKLYALRSLPERSSLCVFAMPEDGEDVLTIDSLTLLGEYQTPGRHSCYITLLDSQAVVSDYTSGTLSLFNLDSQGIPIGSPETVTFKGQGPDKVRQALSHIHSSWVSPDGSSIVIVDLGGDKIYRYSIKGGHIALDTKEELTLPAGCGPRHCAFNTSGNRLYVATELSDEVLTYSWPEMNLLHRCIVNDSLPRGGGHIIYDPDGYLFVSSRLKNDGIAVFKLQNDGTPEKYAYIKTGAHPRHFAISGDGKELISASRDEDVVEFFTIDLKSRAFVKHKEHKTEKPVFIILNNYEQSN